MFCIKCGIKNQDDAAFCYKCGQRISTGESDKPDEVSLKDAQDDITSTDETVMEVVCPKCGIEWELNTEDVSKPEFICEDCKTAIPLQQMQPTVDHSIPPRNAELKRFSSIPDKCPRCDATNITKLTLYEKKIQREQGCGCTGCLLIIIIMIIAPWLIPLLGLTTLAGGGAGLLLIAHYQWDFMLALGIFAVLWILLIFITSRRYICEKCGKKFM